MPKLTAEPSNLCRRPLQKALAESSMPAGLLGPVKTCLCICGHSNASCMHMMEQTQTRACLPAHHPPAPQPDPRGHPQHLRQSQAEAPSPDPEQPEALGCLVAPAARQGCLPGCCHLIAAPAEALGRCPGSPLLEQNVSLPLLQLRQQPPGVEPAAAGLQMSHSLPGCPPLTPPGQAPLTSRHQEGWDACSSRWA